MALLLPMAIKAQVELPYTCGFEGGEDLSGWKLYNEARNATISTGINWAEGLANSGTIFFVFSYTLEPPQYLISPELTGTENGVVVEFYYRAYKLEYGPETFKVGYSMESNDVTDGSWLWEDEVTADNTTYEKYSTTFPAGVKYVAVACTSYDVYCLFVDDFSFTDPNPCAKITNVQASNITHESADISWTAGDEEQDQWQISFYTDESETPDDGNVVNVNTNPFTLTGLASETTYYLAVRAFCGGDSYSRWSKVASFTTGETTGIIEVDGKQTTATDEDIYNLQGAKLNSQPKQDGVYINNGKKIVFK